ncbi:MAG: hypothetical protein K0R18_111 [Bacillales bacterium]|jgi:uncharacterized phage protein gp47/JayE|nr:hypothetical protein [Bacillales bacterium]
MKMKSLSEIAFNLITHIHDTLPEVDTKEGTFVRDVFIDPIATEIASLYRESKLVELAQSILTASDGDLDKLAKNYFIERKGATQSSGKLRFYLGFAEPSQDVIIPRGTLSTTINKATTDPKQYATTETITIIAGNPSTYHKDIFTNQWYVDADAVSQKSGTLHNADAGTIVQIASTLDSMVTGVSNPFSFTGGSDREDDASLILRMSLVVSGSNIGTKDGYKSFVLSQSDVADAIVIGAGEPLMKRDDGEGGMVDIYVRAEQSDEDRFNFNIDYEYITDNSLRDAYPDIMLRKQPVLSINDISGTYPDPTSETGFTKKSYINGSNFKIEKGTSKYFQDIYYDTAFVDVPLTDLEDDELLKAQATNSLNAKLKRFLTVKDANDNVYYDRTIANLKYDTDFSLIDASQDHVLPTDVDFYRGYYSDGLIYVLLSKSDASNPYVGGRYFVQKDGKLFERTYHQPDFIVVKDVSVVGNSVNSKDAIRWTPDATRSNLPRVDEVLTIIYTFNSIISELQDKIESKRVLTADVLLKGASRVPIEIKLDIVPDIGYSKDVIRKSIISKLTSYINDQTKMGGIVDRSDIVFIARGTEGIDAVNLDSVYLAVEDGAPIHQISLNKFEYMQLVNTYINVMSAGTVV